MTLLVFGSINADVTVRVPEFPAPGETIAGSELETATGGKSANQAVAAALAGVRTAFVGRTGADAQGRAARQALAAEGVDVSAMVEGSRPTGTALITVRKDGENTIVIAPGANAQLGADDCPPELLERAEWVLLGLEVPLGDVAELARRARAAGARVALNLSPVPAQPFPLDDVDLVIVNEHEAALLLASVAGTADSAGPSGLSGTRDASDCARLDFGRSSEEATAMSDEARALGVSTVVVTSGAEGAVIVQESGERSHVPAVAVEVVDTTGCGDAFAGVLVGRLAEGDDLIRAAEQASRFAAHAATGAGAQSSYPRDFQV